MHNETINKAIEYLKSSEYTNYRISKDTGISQPALGRYRNEGVKPTPANAMILVQYFEGSLGKKSEAVRLEDFDFVLIPHVPVTARAGYMCGFGDKDYIKNLPTIPVIVDKHYKGKYRVFDVEGDSMDNGTRLSLYDKDKVLCREIKKDLWQYKLHINDWFFVIVHKEEGVVVKQIIDHNVDTGEITCHSLNPLFKDFTLNLNDVLELYNVIKIVDRNTRI